jgi:hypothetical protein
MSRRFLFILVGFVLGLSCAHGQTQRLGLMLPPTQEKVTFPFIFVNNLIVIPITINNQITVKFILDTGANNAILTERIFGDIIGLTYDRTISIAGPGVFETINAYVANGLRLGLPKGIRGRQMSMLVLDEDYIELKKNLGEDVYGIIGYDVFSRFVVEINFSALEVTFHNPESFKPRRRLKSVDLEINGTKPFINAVIEQNNHKDTLKLMIDTGASHALLVDLNMSNTLVEPDTTLKTTLGFGLGGEILGEIGRFDRIDLGPYSLQNILVSLPSEGAYSKVIKRGSRDGTIGGHLLLHFNPIIDYRNNKLYLSKSNNFTKPFRYDMSGLRVSYFENPQRYQVTGIMENSPADVAGIEIGDVLLSVNTYNVENSRLTDIYNLLRSRPKKHIKVILDRNGERLIYKFRLKKLI